MQLITSISSSYTSWVICCDCDCHNSDLLHKVDGDVANKRNNFSVEVVRDTARTVGRNQSAAICPVLVACIKKCLCIIAYRLLMHGALSFSWSPTLNEVAVFSPVQHEVEIEDALALRNIVLRYLWWRRHAPPPQHTHQSETHTKHHSSHTVTALVPDRTEPCAAGVDRWVELEWPHLIDGRSWSDRIR